MPFSQHGNEKESQIFGISVLGHCKAKKMPQKIQNYYKSIKWAIPYVTGKNRSEGAVLEVSLTGT